MGAQENKRQISQELWKHSLVKFWKFHALGGHFMKFDIYFLGPP